MYKLINVNILISAIGFLISNLTYWINSINTESDLYFYINNNEVVFEPLFNIIVANINHSYLVYIYYCLSVLCYIFFAYKLASSKYLNSQRVLFLIGIAPVLFSALLRQQYATILIFLGVIYSNLIILFSSIFMHYGSIFVIASLLVTFSYRKYRHFIIFFSATTIASMLYILQKYDPTIILEYESLRYAFDKFQSYMLYKEFNFEFKAYIFYNIALLLCLCVLSERLARKYFILVLLIMLSLYPFEVISERSLLYFQSFIALCFFYRKKNYKQVNFIIYLMAIGRIYQDLRFFGFI